MILNNLDTSDVFSVISFSDRAEVIVEASHIKDKSRLLAQIQRLKASGGTEIYQGLQAGLQEVQKSDLSAYTNHLILLTDGHTYGDTKACLSLSKEAAISGVDMSVFGIGPDWNDRFLDKLAGYSGGKTVYVESSREVVPQLQKRISGLCSAYAINVRLDTGFPSTVELSAAFKIAPFAQPLVTIDHELHLGAIEGRSPLAFLLEFSVEPLEVGHKIPLTIYLAVDIPSKKLLNTSISQSCELPVVDEEHPLDPPQALVQAVQAWNFYQMNERTWKDVKAGNIKRATRRMRRLTTRLLETGHPELAERLTIETEHLSSDGSFSLGGRKRLKFGTRSLATETFRFQEADDG
jgi:Ca-activated chloride channel family protein